jgi:hypothetical protein
MKLEGREEPTGRGSLERLLAGERVPPGQLQAAAAALGSEAIDPLLNGLALSGSREVRMAIIDALQGLGEPARDRALARAQAGPWFVTRNLMVLLARLPLPPGFDPAPFLRWEDPRVRVEAVALVRRLANPAPALGVALADADPRVVTAALRNLDGEVPLDLLEPLRRVAASGEIQEMRVQAVAAIARCPDPAAIPILADLVGARRRFLLGLRLPRTTPVMVEALRALATAVAAEGSPTPEVGELLMLAARSRDPLVRAAVPVR